MPTKEPTKPAKAVGVRGQVPVWYVDREGNLCYPDCTAATTIHAWAGEFLQLSPEKKHMPDQLSAEHTPASSPSKAAPGMGVAAMVNGEFPTLSNNLSSNPSQQSTMWSTGGRNLGAPNVPSRNQSNSTQPSQSDDVFNGNSRLASASGQSSFRFGNQATQNSQAQRSSVDDFPPLNRNANGDIGQERGNSLMSSSFGFGAPGAASSSGAQAGGAGNGLLNALSANSRATDARSPTTGPQSRDVRSSVGDEAHKAAAFRDDSIASQISPLTEQPSTTDSRNPHGAIGAIGSVGASSSASAGKAKAGAPESSPNNGTPNVQDPLAGMTDAQKWGLPGLRHLMNTDPTYSAFLQGIDAQTLGLDLQAPELISEQISSLWDSVPPRPAVPKFVTPDCYRVNNVQPIENKIGSFNEETLFFIFYSCPRDVKQHLAAIELNTRNWRWHKRAQVWLTKDDTMHPQILSNQHERGYYIVWDTSVWRKEKKELTLYYADLDPTPQVPA